MAVSGISLLKTFIKSSLDNYVLPGTLTGTEILLLYMSSWKRNVGVFIVGALHLIQTELALLDVEDNSEALSECATECVETVQDSHNALS